MGPYSVFMREVLEVIGGEEFSLSKWKLISEACRNFKTLL